MSARVQPTAPVCAVDASAERVEPLPGTGSKAANEARATPAHTTDDASASAGSDDEGRLSLARNNLVKRTIDEICSLLSQVHDVREDLIARGVLFHMLNALIELGVSDKPDEQATLITTAVEASFKAHGKRAIAREELEAQLALVVTFEKDLRHARQLAGQQGVNLLVLSHLTQLIRQNPGDNGVQAVNTFVAYADAAGIPLDRVGDILGSFSEEPVSVLPDIPPDPLPDQRERVQTLLTNLGIGCVLTVAVMWLVL